MHSDGQMDQRRRRKKNVAPMGQSLLSLLFPDVCLLSDMSSLLRSSSGPGSCSMPYWCSSTQFPAPLYQCAALLLLFLMVWLQSNLKGCHPVRATSTKVRKDECSLTHNPYVPLFLRLNKLLCAHNVTLMHVGYKFMSSLSYHCSSSSDALGL